MPLDDSLVPVDRERAPSITRQIVELVLGNMEQGALGPGERLPTERELAQRLGVARGTVKAAYRRLESQGVIRTRQGSGSYVVRDEELARRLRKEKAVNLVQKDISTLTAMGFSPLEISRLFDACLTQMPDRVIRIAVLCDAPELLLDFKRQLSFLQGANVSLFLLESITENHEPQELLRGCDLIVAPADHHSRVQKLLPEYAQRLVKAAVSPSAETMAHLAGIPRDARIGMICRSSAFLTILKEQLGRLGFGEGQILSFFEMDYTTQTYFPGGIDVLISFSGAHIFTNPAFAFRNEEFWAKGGKIIAFRHQIDRTTLLHIEERVRNLRASVTPDAQ